MRFRSLVGLSLLFAVAPGTASAQSGQKLAYVNSGVLLQNAPGRAEAEAVFDKEMIPIRAQLQKLQDSVTALSNAFAKEEPTLAGAAKEARVKSLQEAEKKLQDEAQKLQEDAQDRQEALMAPIMDALRKALDDVRTEGGYAFIFDVAVQMPYIVSADKNLDVTDRVLAKLRLAAPKVAPAGKPGTATKPPAAGPTTSPAGVTTKKPPL